MSLYNLLFGKNSNTKELLDLIGLNQSDIPRFRDCYLNDSKTQIIILTRTGGGNRNDDPESTYYGPFNDDLRKNIYYIKDEDCEFDSTYAEFYFSIPQE